MNTQERQQLLDSFLQRWPIESVRSMNLSEYVGVKNPDTFCQWIETKTRLLGSIKGSTSIKFGIFERKDKKKRLAQYNNDSEYTWLNRYGDDRKQAFDNVLAEIVRTIEYSEKGKFELIDEILLSNMFKWKIAFLYSNERLIPIYEPETLKRIATHYGLVEENPKVSKIQQLMVENKPETDVYGFMGHLWERFNEEGIEVGEQNTQTPKRLKTDVRNDTRLRRVAAIKLNTDTQVRTIARSYVVEQKHKKLQLALRDELILKYGKSATVVLEENFVDLKLVEPDCITFFEVKSSSYAATCVREAIGQLLYYSCFDDKTKRRKLVVVGQYPPTNNDLIFIDYVRSALSLDLEYVSVKI